MKIKEVFPTVYAVRYSQEVESIWEQEYVVTHPHLVGLLDILFNEECALAHDSTLDEFRKHINLIFAAIIAANNNPATVLSNAGLDLLLLIHGAKAAGTYNRRGSFPEVFDCFMKSLYGRSLENGEQYDLQPERLWRFANPRIWPLYPGVEMALVITRWLAELFYYARSFGGLSEWCEVFLQPAIAWARAMRATTMEGALLATQLYAWSTTHQPPATATQILTLISTLYDGLDWAAHGREKQHLGVHLVLTTKQLAQRQAIHAELTNQGTLSSQERMQIACEVNNGIDDIKANFDAILSAVRDYSRDVESRAADRILVTYEKSRLFKVLNNLILTLCQHAATTELAALMTAFYHPDANWEPQKSILFILPNALDGVYYCANEKLAFRQQDNVVAVPNLIEASNRALSQLHVLRGTSSQKTPLPERVMGMPMFAHGANFEQAISEFYGFSTLKKLDIAAVTSLCPFNFNQLPLQALMLKELQVTFPIYTSLQQKAAYPVIRRVLLWQGNSVTSEMEACALAHLFSRAGVELTVLTEGTATKQDFIDAYRSSDYDVIWVSSHGELGYYEPDNSSFSLSETEAVSLAELVPIPVEQLNVRLLFLNVCEGGANTQIGEFQNVGFGHMLTSHNQDVLSHLWMTDSLVAPLLGVLVALELCQSRSSYFNAYQSALQTLLAGQQHLVDRLTALNSDTPHPSIEALLDRLQNKSSMDLANLLKWGSAVYFT